MRALLDWCFGTSCGACGHALVLDARAAFCDACETGLAPCGVWKAGPEGLPIAGGWAYAASMAAAIVRAKNGQHRLDLAVLKVDLSTILDQMQSDGDDIALVAVPPQRSRLIQRGLHLPDLLATSLQAPRLGRRVVRALQRTDLQAPRRADRSELPVFAAPHRRKGARGAVLIDDVVTSGQTLERAAATLRGAGWLVRGALCLADARPTVLAELLAV